MRYSIRIEVTPLAQVVPPSGAQVRVESRIEVDDADPNYLPKWETRLNEHVAKLIAVAKGSLR